MHIFTKMDRLLTNSKLVDNDNNQAHLNSLTKFHQITFNETCLVWMKGQGRP